MKITIFKKLLVGFGAMLLLTCFVGGAGFYGLSGVKGRIQKTFHSNVVLQKEIKKIKDSVLEARRHEKNFLLNGDESYVGQVEEHIARIKKGALALWTLRIGLEQEDENRTLTQFISAFADEYQKGFLSVADKIKEKDHSVEGVIDFRRSARRLEDAVRETGQKQILIDLLMIRRYEKNYFLYREIDAIGRVQTLITSFKTDVDRAPLSVSSKAEIKRQADHYGKQFMRIVVLDAGIERLRGVYTDAARRIEEMVEEISVRGEEWTKGTIAETDHIFAQSDQWILTFLLLSLGFGGGLAFFLSRGLSRPVKGLAEAAIRIAGGDLTRTVRGRKGNDEVGELARAFNRMAQSLQERDGEVQAAMESLRRTNQELEVSEEKIRQISENLEKMVEERTAELSKTQEELRIGYELSTVISTSKNSEMLLHEVLATLAERMPCKQGGIYVLDEATKTMRIATSIGLSGEFLKEVDNLPLSDARIQKVLCSDGPLVTTQGDFETGTNTLESEGIVSAVSLPIRSRDRLIGIANLVCEENFSGKESVLRNIGTQLAVAVENTLLEKARKRAEEKLRESEERFRHLVFSTSDWVWETDANGAYSYCSKKVQDILGYTPAEMIGKTSLDFMPEEEAKKIRKILEEIKEEKQPINDLENWNVHKDGRRLCLLTNGIPIFDVAGNWKGYRGVDKDITERKRAEEMLVRQAAELSETNENLEEKERLLSAFSQIGQVVLSSLELDQMLDALGSQILEAGIFPSLMIALVEEESRSVEVVRNMNRLHGATIRTSNIRTSDYDVTGLRYDLDENNITAEVAHTGEIQVIEGWDERFDQRFDRPENHVGRVAYFIPVKTKNQVLAVLATGSHIEEKEAMLRQIEVMRPLLDEVAIALEHARLYRTIRTAKEAAEVANHAKSEFLANMSHE
ncbi:MAG: PAS domain S-box protein, partial [Candidatus Latescibacteria bacterium]|nr:PAS domain S-box protein [Candidatus Latescibacterota bacterium]